MNMGLAKEAATPGPPVITVMTKKGRRIIENTDEVVQTVTAAFPSAVVETLDGMALATMSMRDQARPCRPGWCSCTRSGAWLWLSCNLAACCFRM